MEEAGGCLRVLVSPKSPKSPKRDCIQWHRLLQLRRGGFYITFRQLENIMATEAEFEFRSSTLSAVGRG